MSNALIVYYSRTGTTQKVAQDLAERTGWEVEELHDTRDRMGLAGYLRAGYDAWFGRRTVLATFRHRLADYPLVVIGTPIWNASLSSPVRTFLADHRGELRQVAFFVCFGGTGSRRVLDQMAQEARATPLATLALRQATVEQDGHREALDAFAADLRAKLGLGVVPPTVTTTPPAPAGFRPILH